MLNGVALNANVVPAHSQTDTELCKNIQSKPPVTDISSRPVDIRRQSHWPKVRTLIVFKTNEGNLDWMRRCLWIWKKTNMWFQANKGGNADAWNKTLWQCINCWISHQQPSPESRQLRIIQIKPPKDPLEVHAPPLRPQVLHFSCQEPAGAWK